MIFDYLVDQLIQLFFFLLQFKVFKYLDNFLSKTFHWKDRNKLEIVHESENFLVVNKPFDLLINSNDESDTKVTLQTQLRSSRPSLVNTALAHEFYFAHRLDYATSGLMCIALNKAACGAAGSAFQNRTSGKYYLAILRGHLSKHIFNVDEAIGEDLRDIHGSHRMCGSSEAEFCHLPRPAKTRVLLLQKGFYNGDPASKVMLKPFTGRRHQLRVHCAFVGHPIVGDFTYSNQTDTKPYRMFLHAFRLVIPNQIEHLDIRSQDPFIETDPRNKWKPTENWNALDETTFSKIDVDLENELESEM